MSEETPENSRTQAIDKLLQHAKSHGRQLGTITGEIKTVQTTIAGIGVKVERNISDISDNRTDIKELAAIPHCDPPALPPAPPPKPTIKEKLKLRLGPLHLEGSAANITRFFGVLVLILLLLKSHGVDIFQWIAKLFQ